MVTFGASRARRCRDSRLKTIVDAFVGTALDVIDSAQTTQNAHSDESGGPSERHAAGCGDNAARTDSVPAVHHSLDPASGAPVGPSPEYASDDIEALLRGSRGTRSSAAFPSPTIHFK
jgi:hypothetical protein